MVTDMRGQLADIAQEIEQARGGLAPLLLERTALVVGAVHAGMSYRDIADELGVSHVAVLKIYRAAASKAVHYQDHSTLVE